MNKKPFLTAMFVACAAGLLAAGVAWTISAVHGLAAATDAAFYCQAAESFARGTGIMSYDKDAVLRPLAHYPPLYPVFLSWGLFLGMSVVEWARCLQAGLFGINVILLSSMAFYFTRRLRDVAIVAVVAVFFVHFLQLHVTLVSEPLFFMFMLVSLWAMIHYLQGKRWIWLAVAVFSASASVMTRYPGIALPVSLALTFGMASFQQGRSRWIAAAGVLAAALSLPALWIVRNIALTQKPFGFVLLAMPASLYDVVRQALDSFALFLWPASWPVFLRIALMLALGIGLGRAGLKAWRNARIGADGGRVLLGWQSMAVFALTYLSMEIASSWFTGTIPLIWRLLIPAVVVFIPVFPTLTAGGLWKEAGVIGRALVLLAALLMGARALQFGVSMYKNGYGYFSRDWAGRPLVSAVRSLPEDVPVYASDPEAFYLYTGRPAYKIPYAGMRAGYLPSPERLRTDFVERRAVAVMFDEKNFIPHPQWRKVVRDVPLAPAFHDGWGTAYVAAKPQKGP